MRAFEELERQLLDSVAERAPASRRGGMALWLRRRLREGTLSVAVSLAVAVVAVTMWLGHPPAGERVAAPGGSGQLEASCPACRAFGGRLHSPPATPAPRAGTVGKSTPAASQDRRGPSAVRWAEVESERLAAG